MNFITKHKILWLITDIIALVLAVAMIVGYVFAYEYRTVINQVLNVQTFRTEKDENAERKIYFESEYDSEAALVAHEEQLCANVMAEGAALLKNNNGALPLKAKANVSLFSQSSVRPVYGGTGSGQVNISAAPTFKEALTAQGINVNPTLWNFYATGDGSSYSRKVPSSTESRKSDYGINEVPWSRYGNVVKNSFTSYNDAAIVVLGRSGGEGTDLAITEAKDGTDGDYLKLSREEAELLKQLGDYRKDGTFKSVIVLLNTSNMLHLDFLENSDYAIDACLWIGDLGVTGINGVARLLAGETAPSGRTVETFLKNNMYHPSMANFGAYRWNNLSQFSNVLGSNNEAYVVYQEGIYVGYRYFETRYTDYVLGNGNPGQFNYNEQVAYPFGSGLSYTTFSYDAFTARESGNNFVFDVTVHNTGDVAAKHTVMIYLQAPYTAGGIEKAAVKLVGFEKTEKIDGGATKKISVTVPRSELVSYDSNNAKTYILEGGKYLFTVGTDAHNAANNFLASAGKTPQNTANKMDAAGNAELVWSWENASTDTKTYAVSKYTENAITNKFDNADILKYEGMDPALKSTFKYLSRNDWEGTYPKNNVVMNVTDQMTKDGLVLGGKNREGEIYANLVAKYKAEWVAANGAVETMPTLGASNGLNAAMMRGHLESNAENDVIWQSLIDQLSWAEVQELVSQGFHATAPIASINLGGTKNENGPQGLTASLVGGNSAMAYTSEDILAATFNRELARDVGDCMGEDCLYAGYSGMYAPGANIHRTPYSGRNFEYYSEDGFVSGEIGYEVTQGIITSGVLVQVKHFALNDQEDYRFGIATWANEQSIREVYLKAFEKILGGQGLSVSVMSSYNRIGIPWAGAHRGLITGILSDEWGVQGSNITDCSNVSDYMDGVLGVLAGTHLWDGAGSASTGVQNSYQNDPVVVAAMKDSALHVIKSIVAGNAMNGTSTSDRIVILTPWYLSLIISLIVIFSVLTAGLTALFVISIVKNPNKGKKQNITE